MIRADPSDCIIRKQVVSVEFGLYNDADVLARSVVEITSSQAFLETSTGGSDENAKTALPGGLYDARLGPYETHDPSVCVTCGCNYKTCPGHFGHVELCLPLYQPLLFRPLLNLLQCKCYSCHHLRTPKRLLLLQYTKLLLLAHGRLDDFYAMDQRMAVAVQRASQQIADMDIAAKDGWKRNKAKLVGTAMETACRQIQRDLLQQVEAEHSNSTPTTTSTLQRTTTENFKKHLMANWKAEKKCHHCGAYPPKIKHDQYNKLFQVALSDRQAEHNAAHNLAVVIPSALEVLDQRAKQQAKQGNKSPPRRPVVTRHPAHAGYDSDDSEPDFTTPMLLKQEDDDDDDDEQDPNPQDDSSSESSDDDSSDDEDKDDNNNNNNKTMAEKSTTSREQYFMHPSEVQAQCQLLWENHGEFLTLLLFGKNNAMNQKHALQLQSYQAFFCKRIPVPPSRFRPPMATGGMVVEHVQNSHLSKILQQNALLRHLYFALGQEKQAHAVWIQLQTCYNCFLDSSKDPSVAAALGQTPNGIRQLLEKKEGIFRKHMMGKRVDSACRSVISPDPYVGTNEIGIPLAFARVLTYPTPVTEWNMTELRRLVERGPHNYPGARWVEFPPDASVPGSSSRRIDLTKMTDDKRRSVGAMLGKGLPSGGSSSSSSMGSSGMHGMGGGGYNQRPVIVGRQLRHGDTMLVNRQPTLHKPGIMAHQVRILHNPTQKTIRMHYANCNTYNADFDGDEMNCHYPQSDVARAEAMYIASTDLQYIVPTDGTPLRGLIQDHVCGGVKLTTRDTFLKRWEYQQLLFATLASLPRLEVLDEYQDIQMVPPAILKPEPLWTGKQVITTLLLHLCNSPKGKKHSEIDSRATHFANQTKYSNDGGSSMLREGGLSLERKSKMPGSAFGDCHEEHLVIIRDGELLRGILDKSAFGATDFSMVHGVYEAYGPQKAGLLLNALGRLFTAYIQYYAGHSCRVEDLMLTKESEQARRKLVERAYNVGARACKAWADSDGGKVAIEPVTEKSDADQPLKPVEVATASAKVGQLLGGAQGAENFAALDGYMMSQLNPLASEIVKECLPGGLAVPFPANTFSLMTVTGAKGSIVNQSQVSCALGQQALEGRRVPRMNSGRTLPSFAPYDLNPRADGFVLDRFLTGVRPQEYYFHCMAGREGLVDTAVKTSRSGYLQRCLVKHLEELKVCYDYTVRNGEGGVVQFLYGEDALDPTKASYLDCSTTSFEFMARNHKSFAMQHTPLPGTTIDIAAADIDRHEEIVVDNEESLPMRKGDFVLARRLRSGSEWKRGLICQGWHDALIVKTHKNGKYLDLQYVKDRNISKRVPKSVDLGNCGGTNERAASSLCVLIKPAAASPILSTTTRYDGKKYHLGSDGACVSERVAKAAKNALSTNQLEVAMKACKLSSSDVGGLVAAKFGSALCAPGEAVGSIAAQSVGEPSTQMTLNTFHLAGAGANVTLGIPRLREIIMTASREMKTPTMSIPLQDSVPEEDATRLTRSFKKLALAELLSGHRGVTVRETLMIGTSGHWERAYFVTLKLHPSERIETAFGLSLEDIAKQVGHKFGPYLKTLMKLEMRRSATENDITSKNVRGGGATRNIVASDGDNNMDEEDGGGDVTMSEKAQDVQGDRTGASKDDLSEDEQDSDDEGGEEDGVSAFKNNRSEDRDASYGVAGEEGDDDDGGQNARTKSGKKKNKRKQNSNQGESQNITEEDSPTTADDPAMLVGLDDTIKFDKKANTLSLPPLTVEPSTRPLLMVGLVEKAAERTLIRFKKGIDQAFVNKEEGGRGRCLQTAGVNFTELWSLPSTVVDHHRLMSNDTWAIRSAYGVEAARSNIVEQIRSVFGAYGIEVDSRHLTLIADYMTYEGGYKAMNRIGMEEMSSTLLQMSFETTAHFLTKAALEGTKDNLESPSANIVLGRPIRHGTGAFDLLVKATGY